MKKMTFSKIKRRFLSGRKIFQRTSHTATFLFTRYLKGDNNKNIYFKNNNFLILEIIRKSLVASNMQVRILNYQT